jgi:uncharacterized protein YktA (UPF0223 family)
MNDFRTQIREDIKEYQLRYPNISNIEKDEWAFNYWILDKFFYEDEELIEDKIIDYNDMGVDAYEIYEDTKELYLIQNKYYNDSSKLSAEYVKNDFLLRPITALENGTYRKSVEVQDFFSKYKNHDDFTVYLQIYVTNNNRCEDAEEYAKKFNTGHPKYRASIFYLDDIKEKYYGDTKQNKQNIEVQIHSVNKGTILNINTDDYKLENVLDAKYVFTPVSSIFRLYRDSIEKNYPIFDMNIREYLGNKGVNKKIYETLLDPEDRKNFFYYNNGITMICDKMSSVETRSFGNNINAAFNVKNPQIVNGCQTVNSIYEALKNVDPRELEQNYKDTFVMLKILQINRENEYEEILYKNIVTYNNSQNSIDEKTFVANNSTFNRLKTEFESKGFLLLIKQSDKNSYSTQYKNATKLKEKSHERLEKFGLTSLNKVTDFFVPLEKLLQVVIAFALGGYDAYTKKSNLLKDTTKQYQTAIDFIKDDSITTDSLIDLYLLYKKADLCKSNSEENRFPIPYYLIDGFAKYECNERISNQISKQLSDHQSIENIIKLYTAVTKAYTRDINETNIIDYNKMIKQPVNYKSLGKQRDILKDVI